MSEWCTFSALLSPSESWQEAVRPVDNSLSLITALLERCQPAVDYSWTGPARSATCRTVTCCVA
jgi:hypothetical protein